MLRRVVDRLRGAASFEAIARGVIDELASLPGVRGVTVALFDGRVVGDGTGALTAPLVGDAGEIGELRVDGEVTIDLVPIAMYVSVRLALLGEPPRASLDCLTPRQRQVAELVAHGCTNLEIAAMLSISANAVKKHVSRVLALLEVSNRTELAALTGRWRES